LIKSWTNLLSSISTESTYVAADHLIAPETKHKITYDAGLYESKVGIVVSWPVVCVSVWTQTWSTWQNERSFFILQKLKRIVLMHNTVKGMGINFLNISEMSWIERNESFLYRTPSRCVWNIIGIVHDRLNFRRLTRSITVLRYFVCIKPQTWKLHLIV